MAHSNTTIAGLLRDLDLGNSVAEEDRLLQVARVETSAFTDLLRDAVDLVPGTKGSGKSALFRIFVDFLPDALLKHRKVVVAHGIQAPGDPVFGAFESEFNRLDERQFVSFWCIYLVSLANEQFVNGERYAKHIAEAQPEISAFRTACADAGIPASHSKRTLKEILGRTLDVLRHWKPKVRYKTPDNQGTFELDLFAESTTTADTASINPTDALPQYAHDVKLSLEALLERMDLSLWLMVDRLDEVFPRRSALEKRALRGLLRATRIFSSPRIRVKVFLRDDMLEHVVKGENGFVALSHVTARQADRLRWTEDQILSMVVKRICANQEIVDYLGIDKERAEASAEYRERVFYSVFPPKVHQGSKQSPTLRWIYGRCADGRGVVTPRDVLELLIRAKQRQQDVCSGDPGGNSDWIIGPGALIYGLEELSKRKRDTILKAEFPHLWQDIEKLVGGRTEYDEDALARVLGNDWKRVRDDLVSIGLFGKVRRRGATHYTIPIMYRKALEMTRGRA
jgi:hypothetical protein